MPRERWITQGELEARRAEWGELAARSQFPSAFADPAWVLSWWEHYGDGHEPWTFAIEDDDGSLAGLALLALERSARTRTLAFAGGAWNGIETLVARPGGEEELCARLLPSLSARRGEWDTWRLRRLPTASALAAALLGGQGALRAAAHDLRLQPYIPLPAEVETFGAGFGSKQRNTQGRKWRRLLALGALPRLVEAPEALPTTLRTLLQLRRQRAIVMGQRHEHMDARFESFLLGAVQGLLPARARLWTLELEGRVLAGRLNLIQGPREHSYLLGQVDEHANLSPGNSLELHAIREAIVEGRSELELGPGRDSYKYRLGGVDRELTQMLVPSGSARGRLLTAPAAADLRLRDSAAAEAMRRRRGMTPERPTPEQPARWPAGVEGPASPTATPPRRSRGMRTLMYHDVAPRETRETVGFPGALAARYKLEPSAFEAHLDAIAATGLPVGTVAGRASAPPAAITFDDGGASAMLAAEALERRGWRGHFFITTARVGTPGFLAPDQLRELAARGHVIGSHSHTHATYMGRLGARELAQEWSRSRAAIAEILGAEPRTASVPGGYLSPEVLASAARAGYEVLFTSEPTPRASELDGMIVRGRYTIWATTPAGVAAAYAAGRPLQCGRLWLEWNAKKLAKRVSPAAYQALRRVRARGA